MFSLPFIEPAVFGESGGRFFDIGACLIQSERKATKFAGDFTSELSVHVFGRLKREFLAKQRGAAEEQERTLVLTHLIDQDFVGKSPEGLRTGSEKNVAGVSRGNKLAEPRQIFGVIQDK